MKNMRSSLFALTAVIMITAQIISACAPAVSAQAKEISSQPAGQMNMPAAVPQKNGNKIEPLEFKQAVRKLWEDHITWTRVYIISAVAGLPEADAAAARLLQNQVDIGNAIKPFYGDAAGNQLTSLLKDHILIAVDLLAAAKAGDTAKFNDASTRWYDNANQIAAFLSTANPKNWPLADMQTMMKSHLDLTLAEASARLKADWNADVAAYDSVHAEILQMADMLSEGIINQFPKDFESSKKNAKETGFSLAMDQLWEEHIQWTRFYIMSVTSNLPDVDAAAGRLLQNQVDIGNAVKPIYGDAAGSQLTSLLKDHILIAVDLLAAAKAGDTAKFNDANTRWYDNANQIAAFLSAANPKNWPLADMQTMMKSHLDLTLAEASARLKADWNADVAAYDSVHAEILQMAGMLSEGIIEQFPANFK